MTLNRRLFLATAIGAAMPSTAFATKDILESEWTIGIIPDTPFNIDIVNIRKIPQTVPAPGCDL